MAFLAMAFAVVGLTGLFATFAAPLALQRALLRDAALDEALTAGPDASARLAARLDDSAGVLAGPKDGLAARVQRERTAMHARLIAEADATATRLRWLIVVVTLSAAGFGMLLVGGLARGG